MKANTITLMLKAGFHKIVVVTRKTALDELVERFGTKEQAHFYLEHNGLSFADYQNAHDVYHAALHALQNAIPARQRSQIIDRAFLPNFLFDPADLVVTLGPDGLVVNTAKYLAEQPLLAFNPDSARMDGVLIPFDVSAALVTLTAVLDGRYKERKITLAEASLNDGQKIYAVNDLFVGQRTHVSARYRLRFGDQAEDQISSGIIVSTGAGSTGWLRSVVAGSVGVVASYNQSPKVLAVRDKQRFEATESRLVFSVREPFVSRVSAADLTFGAIRGGASLEIVSQMPQNGVIFSDGIEADFLRFDSGSIATIKVAKRKAHLVNSINARSK